MKETNKDLSAKKRSVLIVSHYVAEANNYSDGLLSEDELNDLLNSLVTEKDLKEFERIRRATEQLRYFIPYLDYQQSEFAFAHAQMLTADIELNRAKHQSFFIDMIWNQAKTLNNPEYQKELFSLIKDYAPISQIWFHNKKKPRTEAEFSSIPQIQEVMRNSETLRKKLTSLKTAIKVVQDQIKRTGAKIPYYQYRVKSVEDYAKKFGKGHVSSFEDLVGAPVNAMAMPNYDSADVDQEEYSQLVASLFADDE